MSLRVMSVQEVVARLDERFQLLHDRPAYRTRSPSDPRRDPRRGAIDLCLPVEQLLWARCSVFAGPFDRFAAEQVCGDDVIDAEMMLGVIAGLVDKSVLSPDRVRRLGSIQHDRDDASVRAGQAS